MGIRVPIRLTSTEAYLARRHGSTRTLSVTELDILDRHADELVQQIENAWPVDTSTSRDAFTYLVQGRRDRIGIVIENDVDYVQFVHEAGAPPDPPLWRTLIPQLWAARRAAVLADMERAIDATERLIDDEARKGRAGLTERQILAGARPSRPRPSRTGVSP